MRVRGIILALVLVASVATAVGAGKPVARGLIVYTSDGSLYVSTAEGVLVRRLTESTDDLDPAWSPDGKKVAFLRSTDTSVELWVVDATGENETKLASDVALGFDWSPDSRRLVYSSASTLGKLSRDGLHLVLVEASTGITEQLTDADRSDSDPQWSPDGDSIVFVGGTKASGPDPTAQQELETDLFTIDPRSGTATRLTRARGVDHSPRWSSDSRHVTS